MNETLRVITLRLFLRELSVAFPRRVRSVADAHPVERTDLAPGNTLAPLLRFQPYDQSYESMLTAIHIV